MRYFNVMVLGPSQSPYEGNCYTMLFIFSYSVRMEDFTCVAVRIKSAQYRNFFVFFTDFVLIYASHLLHSIS